MEDLRNLHYIQEKELPAINHIFYDNSDPYRIKKRRELYGKPYNKESYELYSKSILKNYDISESDKNICTTFRKDYNRKNCDENRKENNKLSKEVKANFDASHIDILQDYVKDEENDYNNENNIKWEKEKDDGLSRCFNKAHLDNDTDEVYKQHYLSTVAHDYTKKPLSKRDLIRDEVDDHRVVVYRDNDELKTKKHSTYETDYNVKDNNNDSNLFGKLVKGNNNAHIKLEDYNYENENPYATESKDNYKPLPVKREIVPPCNAKYHFITDPDYKESPFKSSMKNDYPLHNKYQKEKSCEKQNQAKFKLGYDTNNNKTLYNDSFAITNDKTNELYRILKNLPRLNSIDSIKLDTEGPKGFKEATTTHRCDFRNDKAERTKVFNKNKKIFNGIKDIETGNLLNLSWEFDPVKESLTKKDYSLPQVDDENRFKKAKSDDKTTNQYLKTNNKQDNDHPKLSITQTDYVNYPNKYKYNPRRPPNSNTDNHLFQNDVYNDENKPRYYRSCYETDYQKVDYPVRNKSYSQKESFDVTLNELFPKELRCHSIKKQSVTHKLFNKKEIPPYYRANKHEIERNYMNIVEHSSVDDLDNKKISITHSSYIAPEITIDHAKMPIPLRNIV